MLLRESGYELHYFFPLEDVRTDFSGRLLTLARNHVVRGPSQHWHVRVGDRVGPKMLAFTYPTQPEDRPDVTGYVAFDWGAMDHWYEEAEEVFVHPRDPYHRVRYRHWQAAHQDRG